MPFYRDQIYPRLVDMLGDPPPIRKVRQQIIPLAQEKVLEIGADSGANFGHYDPTRVTKLYALEPNLGMIRLAERQQHRTNLNIEYLDLPGERSLWKMKRWIQLLALLRYALFLTSQKL
jgi:hypothetical protein